MTLREKQSLFARLVAELILWIYSKGWEVTLAEGAVDSPRRVHVAGHSVNVEDAQHMANSLHYRRLAQDLNLFADGRWVTDGGDPAWTEIGLKWESMHPLARWGGHFDSVDSNHFSLEHEGLR